MSAGSQSSSSAGNPGTVLLEEILGRKSAGAESSETGQSARFLSAIINELSQAAPKDERRRRLSASIREAVRQKVEANEIRIGEQINHVLHHPTFQKVESTWRGLKFLVDRTETGATLKIRVLNVTKDELKDDFEENGFDRSALFKQVYIEEYDTYGGDPFGVMIGDYEFDRSNSDIGLLENVAKVAASAHAPFLSAAGAGMFGNWKNFDSLPDVSLNQMETNFAEKAEYAKWRSFRDSEDAKYVGLTLPHVLMREPWHPVENPVRGLPGFREETRAERDDYCWGNAAYVMGACVTRSFTKFGWCATIRGPEGGGRVEGLPLHKFETEKGEVAMKCPSEVSIPESLEKRLASLGFTALVHHRGEDHAAFFGAPNCYKPKSYQGAGKDAAEASERLSAMLPNVFSISRFAHYLKAFMRERIGSFASREEIELELTNWIQDYIEPDPTAPFHRKAERPLLEARVEVDEIPGRPGVYKAVALLRPHFQLEEVSVSLRLVADLPPAGSGKGRSG